MSDLRSPIPSPASPVEQDADEENFHLLTGFNDIFVTLAVGLVLAALAWFGAQVRPGLGGLAVAAASSLLAEVFTRRRRMALPSIVLALGTLGGACSAVTALTPEGLGVLRLVCGLLATAALAVLHWRRFHVPITVALGTAAALGIVVVAIYSVLPVSGIGLNLTLLVAGLALFAVAMWWDSSDRARTTRRSDAAFWLHLFAAPLIVHPVFAWIGLASTWLGADPASPVSPDAPPTPDTAGVALVAVGVYLLLGLVAVAVDRRAMLVSALAYVIVAMAVLFRSVGTLSTSVALTALLVGGLLLLLSAFWRPVRRVVLHPLPAALRARLPAS